MQTFKLLPCAVLAILLSGCASAPPVSVAQPPAVTRAHSERLKNLETAATHLRQQQLAMGQSLTWLEGEIKAMRLEEKDAAPAPVAAPAHTAVEAATPVEPAKPPVAEHHAATSPTPLVPEAAKAAPVSDLSDEDLQAEPAVASVTPAAPAHGGFAVHIASYSRADLLNRGWRELRTQYSEALKGQHPFGTSFTDANGHHWARLNVGPFESRASATAACTQLKARDVFCDVQSVAADRMIAVR